MPHGKGTAPVRDGQAHCAGSNTKVFCHRLHRFHRGFGQLCVLNVAFALPKGMRKARVSSTGLTALSPGYLTDAGRNISEAEQRKSDADCAENADFLPRSNTKVFCHWWTPPLLSSPRKAGLRKKAAGATQGFADLHCFLATEDTPWNSKNSRDQVLGIPKGFLRAEHTENAEKIQIKG